MPLAPGFRIRQGPPFSVRCQCRQLSVPLELKTSYPSVMARASKLGLGTAIGAAPAWKVPARVAVASKVAKFGRIRRGSLELKGGFIGSFLFWVALARSLNDGSPIRG